MTLVKTFKKGVLACGNTPNNNGFAGFTLMFNTLPSVRTSRNSRHFRQIRQEKLLGLA
jgi:hypothetical protein